MEPHKEQRWRPTRQSGSKLRDETSKLSDEPYVRRGSSPPKSEMLPEPVALALLGLIGLPQGAKVNSDPQLSGAASFCGPQRVAAPRG